MDSLSIINVVRISMRREQQTNQVWLVINRPGQPDFFIVLGKAGKEPIQVDVDESV